MRRAKVPGSAYAWAQQHLSAIEVFRNGGIETEDGGVHLADTLQSLKRD